MQKEYQNIFFVVPEMQNKIYRKIFNKPSVTVRGIQFFTTTKHVKSRRCYNNDLLKCIFQLN